MKLKELLKVIPDNYLIGLVDSDPDIEEKMKIQEEMKKKEK